MTSTATPIPPAEKTFLGQPRWFGTLFIVDMWERFSFYGMLAILALFLVASPADGGLGMSEVDAAALFGMYMSLVFMAALPGGWLADRILGARRATLWGGVFITVGHIFLSVPAEPTLYLGLGCIIIGTGLVKPSMAAMIGDMYQGQPERREAAFSLFYMGIQVSALLAPLITGFAAERINWHLGFGIAAIGMVVGLIHYVIGMRRLGDVGSRPANPAPAEVRARVWRRTAVFGGVPALLLTVGVATGLIALQQVLMVLGLMVLGVPVVYWIRLNRKPEIAPYRVRLRAFLRMLIASAFFWMLYAQGPALMNIFAKDSVDRNVLGFEVPASWFQSVQPLFLLVLAPGFAILWVRMGSRVAVPPKFVAGMFLGGVSFVVMAFAASLAENGPVSPLWLLTVYLIIVCGELVVAPVGLSLAAQVAPPGFSSQMIGLFWLFAAVGAASGGQIAGLTAVVSDATFYLLLSGVGLAVAVALAVSARSLTRRLADEPVPDPATAPPTAGSVPAAR
ncbi:peptide MFS transporter [Micromonospora sp. NPDC050187]|uniref:peptide MFS transporter n=1 Tax=Micromonospora sp. NPDC050187 TaxID=3364277 RepID=UPI0037B1C14A